MNDNTPSDRRTPPEPKLTPAEVSRAMMRGALKGYLATIDRRSGHPYASLVTVATEPDGRPLFLISNLALHTQNLEYDPRASLIVDETGVSGDPLAGGRVTFIGKVLPTASTTARRRFLARHPAAEMYVAFADFGFFAMEISRAHYIGGFGRIVDLEADELLIDIAGAEKLIEAEAGIVSHMNEDHSDAIELYARRTAGAQGVGSCRMAGIDPDGMDLINGDRGLRIGFPARISTPADARKMLVDLAAEARRLGASND